MTGISGLYQNTKGARIARGETTEYKERLKEERRQLSERFDRLHDFIEKYEAGELDVELDCPIELLKEQKKAMGQYLYILELRTENHTDG